MVALRFLPLALALGLANAAACRPKPSTTLPEAQTTGPYGPPDGCKYGYVNQYGVCITTAAPEDSTTTTLGESTGVPEQGTSAGTPGGHTTDEAGNTIPIHTDATGRPVTTDEAGNTIPVNTDATGVPVTTDETGNTVPAVTTDEAGNTIPVTDATGRPVTTDSAGNTIPVTTDEAGNTIPSVTTDQAGNTIPVTDATGVPITTDEAGNTIPVTDEPGTHVSTDTAGNHIPVTTDEAGNTIPVTTDEAGNTVPANTEGGNTAVTTDEAGNTIPATDGTGVPVTTDEAGNTIPVTTEGVGNTVPVTTDEAGNTIPIPTDANTRPVTTDEAGNTIPVTTDEVGSTASVTTDEAGNTIPVTTDEAGNTIPVATNSVTVPVTTDEAGNTVPVTTDEAGNTIPVTTDKAGNTIPVTTDEAGNTVPVTTDEAGNTVPVTTDEAGNTIPVTTDEAGNTVPVTTDKASNTIPGTTGEAGNTVPVTTDEGGNTVPVTTDENGNTIPLTTSGSAATENTASGESSESSGASEPAAEPTTNTSGEATTEPTGAPTTASPGDQTSEAPGAPSTNPNEGPTAQPSEGTTTDIPTFTTLPPGATLSPVDTTYTTPVMITTTSPGSDHATVVPIIIPTGGPPEVCWGCPPNVKIDTPEFCVEIFGAKIGDCSDDNNDDDGDDDDDNDDDDDDPSSTEKVSSCTTSVVATYESVFCSVTGTGTEPVTGCSTTAWTTVTGCSVSNSATTTTTTDTEDEDTQPTCGPKICAAAACASFPQKRSLDEEFVSNLTRRGEPSKGEWIEPSDYEGSLPDRQKALVMDMVHDAYQNRLNPGTFTPKLVWFPVEPVDATTSNYILFGGKTSSLAVQGLWGCTAVVVVSKRGAWASHIWENTFSTHQDYLDKALTSLHFGYGRGDPYHPFALAEMINSPHNGDEGVVFGDEENDATNLGTQVYIMAPYTRPWPRFDANPVHTDNYHAYFTDKQLQNNKFNPRPDKDLAYGGLIELLRGDIRSILGQNIPIDTVHYAPMVLTNELEARRQKGTLPLAEQIDILGDVGQTTARGKALIQYHPAKTCRGWAEWRTWFEGGPVAGRTRKWRPENSQLLVREGNRKREECSLDDPDTTSSETSASETSTETSSASKTGSGDLTLPPLPTLTGIFNCVSSTEIPKCLGGLCVTSTSCISFGLATATTTTEEAPAATTEGASCMEDSDCDIKCENDNDPVCLKLNPMTVAGVCSCLEVTKPTNTDPAETCATVVPTLKAGEGDDEDCRCYYESDGDDNDEVSFPTKAQGDAIKHFCNGDRIEGAERAEFPIDDEGITIYMEVTRANVDQEGCDNGPNPFYLDDYCRDALKVLTSCDVLSNKDRSRGGHYIDNGEYGCVDWKLWAEKGTAGDPDDGDDGGSQPSCPNDPPKLEDGEGDDKDCRCYYDPEDAKNEVVKYPRDDQEKAIEGMCGGDPPDPNYAQSGTYFLDNDISIDFGVSRVNINQDGCKDETTMDRTQWKEYCVKALGTLASCDVIGNGESLGGKYIDNGEYGCIEWELSAHKRDE
ncbi:hypothetical protein N0V84_000163 [Fusarium piperis]|uniref:Uncharacterized protein n=1 Tax=Fusarium piperis TaxID=1435070 RepID=A0A9W9BUG3_9HYPO|nr:hypothetical protein N0V84_000163 [Fusarium piperis]